MSRAGRDAVAGRSIARPDSQSFVGLCARFACAVGTHAAACAIRRGSRAAGDRRAHRPAGMRRRTMKASTAIRASAVCVAAWMATASQASQVITLRSGQVGGLPGVAGQQDDIVTFLPNNPPGAAISGAPFAAGDFAGAAGGGPARRTRRETWWAIPRIQELRRPLARS